ncbi:hypothetical protein SBA3_910066 [Candidatus Sulfopaludibacter sp. SbA3]|nr:hypothetical protein SBA3_910066 [Candidatus Sulfopaludibacter sp. SbA3]
MMDTLDVRLCRVTVCEVGHNLHIDLAVKLHEVEERERLRPLSRNVEGQSTITPFPIP